MKTFFLFSFSLICFLLLQSCNSSVGQHNETSGATPSVSSDTNILQWQVRPGSTYLLKDNNDDLYLYLNIKSGESKNDKSRIPLNISLVLDRSGSMGGDKIEYAKKAAKFVVEQLNSNDILSIVNYDDKIEVMSSSQPVKNKEMLKAEIDKLFSRGTTNLSGGVLEGYKQVKSTMKPGYVNRVLLLTDGLANQGITEPAALKKLVESKYQQDGIALSTFGLGADYNEDLLTLLAETGRANYYFIAQADKIPEIFASELKGLLNVVAQNATFSLSLPTGVACEKVYGYPYEIKNGKIEVRFNDVYSNEEKAVLIKLKRANTAEESISLHSTLAYTDAEKFNDIKLEANTTIKLTNDKELAAKKDSVVQEMIAMFTSAEKFDEIMADVDRGDYELAKTKADSTIKYLRITKDNYKSAKLEKQQVQLEKYTNDINSVKDMKMEEKSLYQKSNKSVNYETKKMKN